MILKLILIFWFQCEILTIIILLHNEKEQCT